MSWFGFGKEDKVIDLGEQYKKQQEKSQAVKNNQEKSQQIPVQENSGFFGNLVSNVKNS